ncbi:hypothetical protein GPECTOR_90g529 [Gonium pectorale]|uniref:Chromo domain-containing protein n=1 Tax=Gonium pectorale TaxID=33097 RepID=A0A150G0R2_GONPE|nr:hypothetical protein GPECTOR_90g529 [Gonium pectorale]|eukprot:KXZ43442.1 hypothetical protein GPECTOR_90g529 [Gonium pectorale]
MDVDGSELLRPYKYFKLLPVDARGVEGRLMKGAAKKAQAEQKHHTVRSVAKALYTTYAEASKTVAQVIDGEQAPPKKAAGKRRGCKGKRKQVRGETHFEVSRFEDSKFVKGKLHFLVRSKGFPKAEWLPAAQLQEDLSPDAYRALRKAMKNGATR